MKLSTRSRYGVRMMFELALSYGKGPMLLKEIGKRQEISEKYLSNLIIPLKGAGLVNSLRGAHGGYTLSRDPREITLLEIVSIMEGEIGITDCIGPPEICQKEELCPARKVWSGLNRVIQEYLKGITLEDLVVQEKAAMYYI